AVGRHLRPTAASRARPGERSHVPCSTGSPVAIGRQIFPPENRDILSVQLEKTYIGVEVQGSRRRAHIRILKTIPSVGAREENGLAAAVGEVAGIGCKSAERPGRSSDGLIGHVNRYSDAGG